MNRRRRPGVSLPGMGPSLGLVLLILGGEPALAQQFSLDLNEPGVTTSSQMIQLIGLITVISLAPGLLVMVTSFTRIVVVLGLLRTAMGTQQSPPNQVLVSLALFLTIFIMAPVLDQSWQNGIRPMMRGEIDEFQGFERAVEPIHGFMIAHVQERDLALFMDMAQVEIRSPAQGETPFDTVPLRALIPAFMVSELRRAFEIGFLLFIPFLIIDMVIASVLMAMGMMMLPPIIISLPFKLIFFVLVDGWLLVSGSLVQSFGT